jgi:Family of unknown function (DUF6174)
VTRDRRHVGIYQSTAHIAVILLLVILFIAVGYFFYLTDEEVPDQRQFALQELAARRTAWVSARPAAFRYVIRRSCFCPARITRPFEVTERDGIVRATVPVGSEAGLQPGDSILPDVRSIDEVFDLAERAIRDSDAVAIDYDPAFGFPVNIRIDWHADTVDDEDSYGITDFVVLDR